MGERAVSGLEFGCSRIVTRGQNVFQDGQVEVSMRLSQTVCDEASIKAELLMWRTASQAAMLGVELDSRVAILAVSCRSWRSMGSWCRRRLRD